MPVWGVWLDGAVWFSTSPESLKGRNMARDPRIAIHLESGDDVVFLEGEVERPQDRDVLQRFVDAYDQKYGYRIDLTRREQSIYRLRPRVAQTWRETDFPRSATRWTFEIGPPETTPR
jgi:hypothetical protein